MSRRSLKAVPPRMKEDKQQTTTKYRVQLRALQQQAAQLTATVEQLAGDNTKHQVLVFAALHQQTLHSIYRRFHDRPGNTHGPLLPDTDSDGGCERDLEEAAPLILAQFPLLAALGDLDLGEWAHTGRMSTADFSYAWTSCMQEMALLLHCRDRCPASETDGLILAAVTKALHLGRAATLLNPTLFGRLVDLNLITGEYRAPPAGYWEEAAAAIQFTNLQLLQMQELMAIVAPRLAALDEQRKQLISRFSRQQQAQHTSVPEPAAAAEDGEAGTPGGSDAQQRELLLPLLLSDAPATAASQHSSQSADTAAAAPVATPAAPASANDGGLDQEVAGLLAAAARTQPSGNTYSSWQDLPWVTRDMVDEMSAITGRFYVLSKMSSAASYLLQPMQMARVMLQCFPYYPLSVQVIDGIIKATGLSPG